MSDRTIIHIDLDSFFVSVERVLNPELNEKPVVVGGRPDRRGVIASASYEARKFGLRSAMPLATAVRICPQAIFIEGNFARYKEFSYKFMAILNDFSPFIEPVGIDEAYLDVTGFESLHGSIRKMAIAMKQRIKTELGLPSSIGIAGCKVVAKIASDYSKPDGLVEVPKGNEREFLSPLSVDKLPGVGKKTFKVLKEMGINTVGALSRIPTQTLTDRFGTTGEMIRCYANGIDNSEVLPSGDAKSISRETTFGKDIIDRSYLEAVLWTQSEKVGADLRRKDKKARCVTLKLRYEDFSTITRSHTLPESISADKQIFDTGVKLLDKAISHQRQGVRLIGIGVSNLVEPSQQTSLFTHSDRKMDVLSTTIDRIREKYGFSAIQTGRAILLRDLVIR
ncbi:DNA polymerase IV [Chloroflexota bacterium]